MNFGTQRGLSTHERYAHPAVRNLKRRGAEPPNRNWTVKEVTLLRELEETFKNHKYPNKEISKILTTNTIDQIKYKGKCLRVGSEDASRQEGTQVTEGGCDLLNSGNALLGVEPEARVDINAEKYTHQWKLELTREIERHTEVPPSLKELNARLQINLQIICINANLVRLQRE